MFFVSAHFFFVQLLILQIDANFGGGVAEHTAERVILKRVLRFCQTRRKADIEKYKCSLSQTFAPGKKIKKSLKAMYCGQ